MLTVEELLKPRYKVIADYPGAEYIKVGDVYQDLEGGTGWKDWTEKYPHLFKPLQWWEDRDEKDMPEYVKFTKNYMDFKKGSVYKTTPQLKDDGHQGEPFIYFLKDGSKPKKLIDNKVGVPASFNQLKPATQTEYEEYLKQVK